MTETTDAPGDYIEGDRSQSDKVEEILRLENEMDDMLELETGVADNETNQTRTVATNKTK